MEILDAPNTRLDIDAELRKLVARHQAAQNAGVNILNRIGGSVETVLDRVPIQLQSAFNLTVERALNVAILGAHGTRTILPYNSYLTRSMTTALGALGGLGGLSTAIVELPVSTVLLLREIQDQAVENGFDPKEEAVQFDCVQVLASAGPTEADDGSDFAFLSTRIAMTSRTVQSLIRRVAPHVARILGQKLAAQSVPILGAMAGAGTNYLYITYYREMAAIHFRLRRIAIETDTPVEELISEFKNILVSNKLS